MKRTITEEMIKLWHDLPSFYSTHHRANIAQSRKTDDDERYVNLMTALKGIEGLLIEIGTHVGLTLEKETP
jgi:hypothetical protein